MAEYNSGPEARERLKKYNQRPDVKEKKKEYTRRSDVQEKRKECHKECQSTIRDWGPRRKEGNTISDQTLGKGEENISRNTLIVRMPKLDKKNTRKHTVSYPK